MSEHLPDVDQLPNVKLTPEQDARARDLSVQMNESYIGNYSAARVIVHLQDRIAELERHLNKAEIERAWAIGKFKAAQAEVIRLEDHIIARQPLKVADMPNETTPETERLRQDLARIVSAHAVVMAENKHYKQRAADLERALRYWMPDETLIPAGHKVAWNEHVGLIPEHRAYVTTPGAPT